MQIHAIIIQRYYKKHNVRRCGVLLYGIIYIDWKEERSAQTILDTILPHLHGCIILCHNNDYKIKEYPPTLLETAIAEGYQFVAASELLLTGDTVIDVNGVQKAAGRPEEKNAVVTPAVFSVSPSRGRRGRPYAIGLGESICLPTRPTIQTAKAIFTASGSRNGITHQESAVITSTFPWAPV